MQLIASAAGVVVMALWVWLVSQVNKSFDAVEKVRREGEEGRKTIHKIISVQGDLVQGNKRDIAVMQSEKVTLAAGLARIETAMADGFRHVNGRLDQMHRGRERDE